MLLVVRLSDITEQRIISADLVLRRSLFKYLKRFLFICYNSIKKEDALRNTVAFDMLHRCGHLVAI